MKRKLMRTDGMFITIDVKEEHGKESILMLHKADGRMVLLQLIKDVEKEIEKVRKEGFEEESA